MSVIFEKSRTGKNSYNVPDYHLKDIDDIPGKFLNDGVDLPDVSEVEAVRHYTKLSQLNFGVDNGMYPLGSCTMKYNPKINEKTASLENLAGIHPLFDDTYSQGCLQLMHDLSEYLCKITGMKAFSLIPAAGAHGELASVMIIKKYFESIGENRKVILIPDSAHGTNPASVAMCGFDVKEVPSISSGDTDLEKLKEMVDENVAAMMLTSPNTLGLFDRNLREIAELLHSKGALFYCDGANLNAVMGQALITEMGFDVMHINLHKSFSTPHGGGGPGSGPIGVVEKLEPFLPVPRIKNENGHYSLDYDKKDSIGRVHSFYGNFLVMVKAYTYIRMLGAEGIKDVSSTAVLNANYLKSQLQKVYNLPIDRTCMHEFVLNDEGLPNEVTTNDIAKRILDYGFHAPTIYFPLLIHGAMMIEPTETESKESLDSFVAIMKVIRDEIDNDSGIVKTSPHNTPVGRVDAVTAARNPILKWTKED
jgi:glycine dehydrogenase subunit 2